MVSSITSLSARVSRGIAALVLSAVFAGVSAEAGSMRVYVQQHSTLKGSPTFLAIQGFGMEDEFGRGSTFHVAFMHERATYWEPGLASGADLGGHFRLESDDEEPLHSGQSVRLYSEYVERQNQDAAIGCDPALVFDGGCWITPGNSSLWDITKVGGSGGTEIRYGDRVHLSFVRLVGDAQWQRGYLSRPANTAHVQWIAGPMAPSTLEDTEYTLILEEPLQIVPDLLGMSLDDATGTLDELELQSSVSAQLVGSAQQCASGEGVVSEQSIAAGEYVAMGTAVTVSVCQVDYTVSIDDNLVSLGGNALPVAFGTPDGEHYITAHGDRQSLGAIVTEIRGWERFVIETVDGGPLVDGAVVSINTAHGNYWTAHRDLTVSAAVQHVKGWEQFVAEKVDDSDVLIRYGDEIVLRTAHNHYVSAKQGGGGILAADGPEPRGWEVFTLFEP